MMSQSSARNNLMRRQYAKYPTAVFLERLAGSPLANFRSLTGRPGLARVKTHVQQGVQEARTGHRFYSSTARLFYPHPAGWDAEAIQEPRKKLPRRAPPRISCPLQCNLLTRVSAS